MKVKLYNQSAENIGEAELADAVFGLRWNADLVHQAYRAGLAAKRRPVAHAKNRGEVSGGGKKPWAQKGTGRARHGSIRSPLWRGGGVTHGPTNERNFKLVLPKKMRKKAIAIILSAKARKGHLVVVDEISLNQPKTKQAVQVLANFRHDQKKIESTLILIPGHSSLLQRSFRNIPQIKVMSAVNVGVLDLLSHQRTILLNGAISALEKNLIVA